MKFLFGLFIFITAVIIFAEITSAKEERRKVSIKTIVKNLPYIVIVLMLYPLLKCAISLAISIWPVTIATIVLGCMVLFITKKSNS
ncbi:putative membrane protein [Lachnospiraceae bacterium PF1-22]